MQQDKTPESTESSTAEPSSTAPKVTATRKAAKASPKPATRRKPAKASKSKPKARKAADPDDDKNVKRVPAPKQRERLRGDCDFMVTLQPRHAEWVRRRARAYNRTEEQMLEKIVREGYAADPDNKTGASTQNSNEVGRVAEQNQASN